MKSARKAGMRTVSTTWRSARPSSCASQPEKLAKSASSKFLGLANCHGTGTRTGRRFEYARIVKPLHGIAGFRPTRVGGEARPPSAKTNRRALARPFAKARRAFASRNMVPLISIEVSLTPHIQLLRLRQLFPIKHPLATACGRSSLRCRCRCGRTFVDGDFGGLDTGLSLPQTWPSDHTESNPP